MRFSNLAIAFVSGAAAQTSTFVLPGVPSGTPIPGNYTGALRPQVHFSPPQKWMNDPNGCFLDNTGTWHLYYQYNPLDIVGGNQHWGHATSRDLYHWENQAIALYMPNDHSNIFTGSIVIDPNNTSGFFPNQTNGVVAIYTLNIVNGPEVQNIAYSYDSGYTFIDYASNPVINSTSNQFRDPKVLWYEDHWVMVVAFATESTVGIYTSPNLRDWTNASNFTYLGTPGPLFECPNLVEMPVNGTDESMWLMLISRNPISVSQYFPGQFNGTHFVPVDDTARVLDFGTDNYAGQFFHNTSSVGDAIFIAWAVNLQYGGNVPTGPLEGWRSSMTLPRRIRLANISTGWTLVDEPYDLSPILGAELMNNSSFSNASATVDFSDTDSNAVYLSVNVSNLLETSAATLNFTFQSPISGESLVGGYSFGGNFSLDRGGVKGFSDPSFTSSFSTTPLFNETGTWTMEVVFDRSIIEIFLGAGTSAGTAVFFPEQPLTLLNLQSTNIPEGAEIAVRVSALESAWKAMENENGTVVGNVTMETAGGQDETSPASARSTSRGLPIWALWTRAMHLFLGKGSID